MLDPETSRFLQEDTYTGDKKDPLSLNLYTYCHNNPLIYDDPTGHFAHILLGGLVGGVLSVAATGITNLVTTGKLGSAKQYVGAFASGFVEGAVGAATLGIGSIAAKVAIDAATSFGSNLIEQKITTGKVSLKKAAVETATGMAISGAASKVAKKFQNSKINQKLTKKLDDITSSLKSKTKNITANIAKKTKEVTQKTVNTVSDKVKTIANKTLNGTSTSKSVKNKVASAIDSLGEGILNVQNAFAPTYEFAEIGPIKAIKTGFGESGEETLSQFLSKDVKQLKTMFFSQGNKSGRYSLPQGISQEQFSNASKLLRDRVGDISNDIVVQGSRAKGTAKPTSDIDIALRVSGDKFDSLINQYFKTPNPGSAKERTMLHAIETGKIQAGEAKLSGLRKELQEIFGMEVDISIIKQGGAFDNPPFIPFE